MEITCNRCAKSIPVVFVKKYQYPKNGKVGTTINVYRDERGFLLYGPQCKPCFLKRVRKKGGWVSREESKNPRTMASLERERKVGRFFESLGFSVDMGHGAGPDMFCRFGPWVYTVEAKHAQLSGKRWRVDGVRPARKNDDLVGILLPNGRVYIDSMENHLKNCVPSDGSRNVRALVMEFGLDPLPQS